MIKKVGAALITIVVVMLIGFFILNILVPNAVVTACSAFEDSMFKATGISIDINGDGRGGQSNANNQYTGPKTSDEDTNNANVEGFQ